ncbi:MAG TPA: hypothetical protein VK993_08975 [Chthoniobacterales bacterium]|nr:hypothetical protein [Chthoniobacterales bacterium]
MTGLAKLVAAVRQWSLLIAAALAIINTFVVISPALRSGFSWDDNVLSTLRALFARGTDGLLGVIASGTHDLFLNQGRFFALSAVANLPLYLSDRFGYKLSIVALALLNVAALCLR